MIKTYQLTKFVAVCDECGFTYHREEYVEDLYTATDQLVNNLEAMGWLISRHPWYYRCPDCTKKYIEKVRKLLDLTWEEDEKEMKK